MSLKCTVRKVVLIKQMPVFMLVQLGLKGQSDDRSQINKFRTQLSLDTPRPQFHRNEFIFNLLPQQRQKQLTGQQVYSLKFGLMLMPCDNYGKIISEDYNKAKPIALTSLSLSLVRLKENGTKPEIKYFEMVDNRGKVYGQFECVLEYFQNVVTNKQKQQQQFKQLTNNNNSNNQSLGAQQNTQQFQQSRVLYDPLISWMMYDENCSDPLREKNCIRALQQQSNLLYTKFHKSKTQQQQYQSLLNQLQHDQKQLLQELQMHEKMNNKIGEKLNQKQSLQGLKLEIDMLRGSKQGRQLLLDRVEYFQDRIMREEEMYDDLVKEYKKLKPQIEKKLKQGELISEKLKGKQEQEFQINNNQLILKNYEQILYEYKSNEHVIQSLMKLSKKPNIGEYTRQQAQLFLSQVKYEIKLEQMNLQSKTKGNEFAGNSKQQDYEQKLLTMIEQQMRSANISTKQYYSNNQTKDLQNNNNNNLQQQQQFVMRIKLDSLLEEIEKIKARINKLKDKQQMAAQFSYQNHVTSLKGTMNGGNSSQLGMMTMNKSLMSTR